MRSRPDPQSAQDKPRTKQKRDDQDQTAKRVRHRAVCMCTQKALAIHSDKQEAGNDRQQKPIGHLRKQDELNRSNAQ